MSPAASSDDPGAGQIPCDPVIDPIPASPALPRFLDALAGALLIHPVVCLGVFVYGAIAGVNEIQLMHPAGGGSPRVTYGLEGGFNAFAYLVLLYVFTYGVVPLVLSAVGAVVVSLAGHWIPVISRKKAARKRDVQRAVPVIGPPADESDG